MSKKQKLELTWIGKEERSRLEPRILIQDPPLSYHATTRREGDIFDNMLIQGDNLLALKALEQDLTGRVKCIYIDPPFNTKQAFDHYDDGLEHSVWLSMMRSRIDILHRLLHNSGSLFIHIDDNELGYLIALADEIFGRSNRISIITFKQSAASGPKAINPGIVTTNNFILYYAKDKSAWRPNRVFTATSRDDRYSKYIQNFDEPFSDWRLIGARQAFLQSENLGSWSAAKKRYGDELEQAMERFVLDHAERVVRTARVASKDVNEAARQALQQSVEQPSRVWKSDREGKDSYFFLGGEQLVFYESKTRVIDGVRTTAAPLTNLWDDLLSNNLHAEGGVEFPNGKKPEGLIKRCIELSTGKGDIVLDSFAGSGTTGAVAHKMGRRWIMAELGDHAVTHCVPRLKRVIDNQDPSGVTGGTGWNGGGGFRFFRLASSLLEKDRFGNWVIAQQYNAAMLAEAVCKLMGFTYAPSQEPEKYWQHGHSTETDFIYVTTQSLSYDALRKLSEEVGAKRTLLVCCKAFSGRNAAFENLTVKKIPQTVLTKCEWGRDDYSLRVANLPVLEDAPAMEDGEPTEESLPAASHKRVRSRKATTDEGLLFAEPADDAEKV
jgi:adenine-specific DNA-methyltransferase